MVLNVLLVELGHGGRRLRLQHAPPKVPRRRPGLLRPQRPATRHGKEESARRCCCFAETKSEKSRERGALLGRLFRRRSPAGEEADDAEADVAARRAVAGEEQGGVVDGGGSDAGIPLAVERVVAGQFGGQRQELRDFVKHGRKTVKVTE